MSRMKKGNRLAIQAVISIVVALIGFILMPTAPSFAAPPNPTVDVVTTCDSITINITGYSDLGPQGQANHVETRVDGAVNADGTGDFSDFAQVDVSIDGTTSHTWEVSTTAWDGPSGSITKSGSTTACDGSGPDADGDGVPDANDDCANTPVGADVDANGCSDSQLDGDNDGVNDANDQCPNTPAGTPVDANGCSEVEPPVDADNDGVPDANDDCPNTPAGEEVNVNGCSDSQLDGDNDGVNNADDQCPNTPAGDTVDANGCSVNEEPDADGDGVPNADDQCPGTPVGTPVDADGCSDEELPLGDITLETGCKFFLVTNNEAVGAQLVYGVYPDADDQLTIKAGETLKIKTSRPVVDVVVNFDDSSIGSVFLENIKVDQVCDGNGGGDGDTPTPQPVPTNNNGGSPSYGVPETGITLDGANSINPIAIGLVLVGLMGLLVTGAMTLMGRRRRSVVA